MELFLPADRWETIKIIIRPPQLDRFHFNKVTIRLRIDVFFSLKLFK